MASYDLCITCAKAYGPGDHSKCPDCHGLVTQMVNNLPEALVWKDKCCYCGALHPYYCMTTCGWCAGQDFDPVQVLIKDALVDFSPPKATSPCGDCNGSGKYVGLIKIEPCKLCGGTGKI